MFQDVAPLLEGLLRPDQGVLSPELARYILTLDFTPDQHARYSVLAGKAQSGTLTSDEASEIDAFLAADAFLSILQSKARQSLQQHQPAA
jgi:hypothetical protein